MTTMNGWIGSKARWSGLAWAALAACTASAQAQQSASSAVYRCPGPPVLYTDALSPQEAKDKGCRTIEGAPITIIQGRPKPASAAPATAGA